jgi:hypothetical protein
MCMNNSTVILKCTNTLQFLSAELQELVYAYLPMSSVMNMVHTCPYIRCSVLCNMHLPHVLACDEEMLHNTPQWLNVFRRIVIRKHTGRLQIPFHICEVGINGGLNSMLSDFKTPLFRPHSRGNENMPFHAIVKITSTLPAPENQANIASLIGKIQTLVLTGVNIVSSDFLRMKPLSHALTTLSLSRCDVDRLLCINVMYLPHTLLNLSISVMMVTCTEKLSATCPDLQKVVFCNLFRQCMITDNYQAARFLGGKIDLSALPLKLQSLHLEGVDLFGVSPVLSDLLDLNLRCIRTTPGATIIAPSVRMLETVNMTFEAAPSLDSIIPEGLRLSFQ